MAKDEEKTKVVFRCWPDGGVVALFPQIPSDVAGYYCMSYMHVGQHGAAAADLVVSRTRPARPNEYIGLVAELEKIGYSLKIGKVCTKHDRECRREQCEKMRK